MLTQEVKRFVIQKLQELPAYSYDDGYEHTVRCPYCGDSHDPTHAHLGIKIDPTDNSPMPYHCYRCGASGKVTPDFLEDLEVNLTSDEVKGLKAVNKKEAKLITKTSNVKVAKFFIPQIQPNRFTDEKLAYLNGRLGIGFNYDACAANKIILSLYQFMMANGLNNLPEVNPAILKYLEQDYIGFLSANNNLITFRTIRNNGVNRRYFKAFLTTNDDPATFYSIPTQVPLLYTGPLRVNIAEGTFDILSVRYNLNPQAEQSVFYAATGFRYLGIIRYLARVGMCTNLDLHVYADRDKSDAEHRSLIKRSPLSAFIEHATIHRNYSKGEKDFGVGFPNIFEKARVLW